MQKDEADKKIKSKSNGKSKELNTNGELRIVISVCGMRTNLFGPAESIRDM